MTISRSLVSQPSVFVVTAIMGLDHDPEERIQKEEGFAH